MLKRIPLLLLAFVLLQPAMAHYKALYHVIIDTDGGIDDLRSICMMLATPEIEIIAITTVDGVMPAEETANRIRSLLKHYHHEGIPVGMGKSTHGASTLILEEIALEEKPVDFIALGALSNLALALQKEPGITDQVRMVYWYSDTGDDNDINSVLKSGLHLNRISASGKHSLNLPVFLDGIETISSPYAMTIRDQYMNPAPGFMDNFMSTHLVSDCVPIYMLYTEYFRTDTIADQALHMVSNVRAGSDLSPLLLSLLDSDQEDSNILFKKFPIDSALFQEDVAPIVHSIIEKHGMKEWRIVAITNEFHEHLGIYSILGAKMGLRAREYFHVGIDELKIRTFAGSKPPISCLNDGLQTSTGATMGHGAITLSEGPVMPKARFTFKNRTIELQVQPDIREKIKKEVSYGVRTYGLDSAEYWIYIRKLALKYWLELDRFEIFHIQVV